MNKQKIKRHNNYEKRKINFYPHANYPQIKFCNRQRNKKKSTKLLTIFQQTVDKIKTYPQYLGLF